MARSRSIPTDFFDDPDIFLCDPSSQLLLVALVLFADDHGRGLASVPWLANRLKLECSQVQASLVHLEEVELIRWYQVGRHSYYFICHWHEWETLSRPSVPKYPAPPSEAEPSATQVESGPSPREATTANNWEHPPTNPGDSLKSSAEEEEEGKRNKKRREEEEEWASSSASPNPNALAFLPGNVSRVTLRGQTSSLHAHESAENREQGWQTESQRAHSLEGRQQEMTAQLGSILRLPHNDALARLVEEFLPDQKLSLIAEADAARAWVDDQSRNRRGTTMSLSFFRRWLKREQEGAVQQKKSMGGNSLSRAGTSRAAEGRGASHKQEPNPYKSFVEQRIRQVKEAFAAGVPAEDIVAGRYQHAASR